MDELKKLLNHSLSQALNKNLFLERLVFRKAEVLRNDHLTFLESRKLLCIWSILRILFIDL